MAAITIDMTELVGLLGIVEGAAHGALDLHGSSRVHEKSAATGAVKLSHGVWIDGWRDWGDVGASSASDVLGTLR